MPADTNEWIAVEPVGVDTARLVIVDPSYLTPELVEQIRYDLHPADTQPIGPHGLGAIVATGRGDGLYPMWIRHDDAGRVAELRIVFTPDETPH